jgi:hypothetical protein
VDLRVTFAWSVRQSVRNPLKPMTKKLTASVLLAGVALLGATPLFAQAEKKAKGGLPMVAPPRVSPHETTYVRVGTDRANSSLISLTYGRPYSARGGKGEARQIWGTLVPWEKADRLGSDEATLIVLQHPIEIQGKTIPAGAHTLYIVASQTGTSKLAFSSHIGKWGIPVDETKDIARVDLKKETLDQEVNQLTIILENHQTSGLIKIAWEKTQFSVPFTVKK